MPETAPPISFSAITVADLPRLARWLAAGEARRWYARRDMSYADIQAEYGPKISGAEPTHGSLIELGGAPIGYIQSYLIRDYPAYAAALQVEPGAAGLDLFIGDPAYLHRGFGGRALAQYIRERLFADEMVSCCVVGPDPDNAAAIRAYAKVGFEYIKTVQAPGEDCPEYVMRVTREGLR
ncbi:MAG: GNAT family N-acetyltransferase [Armatimonadetes bacterium]|nr:GNAT family N-acetyltransferase [Armatimonadota bacterium]